MNENAEIFESADGKFRVRVVYDYSYRDESPRDWCPFGAMLAEHRDYTLGDQDGPAQELADFIEDMREWHSGGALIDAALKHLQRHFGSTVVLPLYLYDHSGISMSAGPNLLADGWINTRTHNPFDPGGWDTSFIGFAFDTAEGREENGVPDVEAALRTEVEVYSEHLEGNYFGLVEEELKSVHTTVSHDGEVVRDDEDDDWVETDSCWGYLGYSSTCDEAKSLVAGYEKPVAV